MFLAGLIGLLVAPSLPLSSGEGTWRDYEEVFDLASVGGQLVAATNGGLLRRDGERWSVMASPGALREIVSTSPLTVGEADGRSLTSVGGRWQFLDAVQPRGRSLESGVVRDGDTWGSFTGSIGLAGAAVLPGVPYCAIRSGSQVLVGGSDGLYRFVDGKWDREALPSSLPVMRPNGLAEVHGKYLVGGIGGLFLGRPGDWTQVSTEAVRQVLRDGDEAWVVYGSGAVDKVDPASDRLFPDVFYGATRRPWASCAALIDGKAVFGGQGGWVERGAELSEFYPKEIAGDVVMAMAGRGGVRWVGTQKSGLFEFNDGKVTNWNPGNGLDDTWVTSLCLTEDGLVVGTATKGLFLLHRHGMRALDSPTQRVVRLAVWKGRLVVGAMDGAWRRDGSRWVRLATDGEETTSLVGLDGGLAVATASGVHFLGSGP